MVGDNHLQSNASLSGLDPGIGRPFVRDRHRNTLALAAICLSALMLGLEISSIPSILPTAPAGTGLTARQRRHRAVAADLASAGLIETLSFPFVGDRDWDGLGLAADDERRRTVRLVNPLDAARGELTTTLLPGLLELVPLDVPFHS